ncbi:DUF5522 domain-containing protein [Adhaeribacter rhizoryzae]|nr:DUF5522 domain-containing protein [Adhaeribacter rhizoryzae]
MAYFCLQITLIENLSCPRLSKSKQPPLAPEDYYFNEQGLLVFTENYLRKRGYCCKNGCKHCPYGFTKPQPSGAD